MSEQEKNLYSLEQAQNEVESVKKKASEIAGEEKVEKEDYNAAERDVDLLKAEKQERLTKALSQGYIRAAKKIIDFAKENSIELDINHPEITPACQQGFTKALYRGRIDDAKEIIDFAKENNIEFDVALACQRELTKALSKILIGNARKIIDFAKENSIELDITPACQQGFTKALSIGWIGNAKKIIDFAKENSIELDINHPEIAPACQQGLIADLSKGYIRAAKKIIDFAKKNSIELGLSHPEITPACQQGFTKALYRGWIDDAKEIIDFAKENNIEFDVALACQRELTKALSKILIGNARKIIDFAKENNIELDITPACQQEFTKALSIGWIGNAKKIIDFAKENSIELDLNKSILNYPQGGATIKNIVEMSNIPQIGNRLAESLHQLTSFSFPDQIKPIINAQGEAAFLYFESIKEIEDYQNLSAEDTDYITHIAKKYGTQARNILDNILTKVDSISSEREMIEEFIQDIGIIHFDIYQQYKQAKEENNQEKMAELKEGIKELHNKIYQGEIKEKDFDNELYSAVSYHTFPPAIGVTQDQYEKLNKERPDRKDDVPESLDELQYEKFEVSTGKYNLGENEELNLEKWTSLGEAIKKVNTELEESEEVKINEEKIAGNLIKMYKEKSAEKQENQDYLFESMYRYHLAQGGGKMESGFEISIQGLMRYKEFIGDRIKNDLIKDCLSKWQKKHKEEFTELQKDTLNRIKTSQARNFAKVKNMLKAINKQKDEAKKEKTIQNLDEFLKHFGLSYESVKTKSMKELEQELETVVVEYEGELTEENYQTEEYYNSPAFLKAYDEFLAKHDNEALVYQKISSDLIAGINKKMRKEVDKFQFEGEAGKVEKRELEFAISKKKEHGVAGYNMGVCVAPDEKLWNDKKFMNCVIFDPELKQAMGGAHFLIRENNLCLPGINPSLDVLSSVKNEELFNRIIAYAKKVKDKLGLDKILIPVSSTIHSNRTQIQEIIRNKNFKKYNLKQSTEFSYKPFKYSFQECYEVD